MKNRIIVYVYFIYFLAHMGVRIFPAHSKSNDSILRIKKIVRLMSNGKLGSSNIPINFVKYNGTDVIGRCNFIPTTLSKEIDIVQEKWEGLTILEKFMLVAHELKHCECNYIKHIDETFIDGCPFHYMNSYLPSKQCIINNLDSYIRQIRKGCDED